jgi:hypothetical protein
MTAGKGLCYSMDRWLFPIGELSEMNTAPFLVPLLLIALLHPRARDLFRFGRLARTMLGLTALAAIPWLAFALSQAELQRLNIAADEHAQMEHGQRMAVFASLMIVWGLIGSTNLPGWRLAAWIVAYGAIVYGLQSLVFPVQASAAPAGWAIAAAGWGAAYLVAAEQRRRSIQPRASEATVQPG